MDSAWSWHSGSIPRNSESRPWAVEIAGTAAGPAQNANFNVIFYERMLQQDGAGVSMGPSYRFVVFASSVKPKEASGAASVVSRIYANDPKRFPDDTRTACLAWSTTVSLTPGVPSSAQSRERGRFARQQTTQQ